MGPGDPPHPTPPHTLGMGLWGCRAWGWEPEASCPDSPRTDRCTAKGWDISPRGQRVRDQVKGTEGEPLLPAVPELKIANPFLHTPSPITNPGALGKQRTEEGDITSHPLRARGPWGN